MKPSQANYEVIARKWRPQRFREVVGQEHVKRALQNAIAANRVGHAYLFVGPRGIGKTTIARIFAKALNCEQGIVTEPCCRCPSCTAIAEGSSMDLLEIDAASNRGVDSIRNLRETVQYTPARSRYKIYIIDEVHMLTKEAWNALLKTLEEPPPHVKFLFATTEPHKVLPTILSRCQRFDLRRLSVAQITAQLARIVEAENIVVEPEALATIARVADGALRDAESILDQMISFRGGSSEENAIREQDVVEVFGLAALHELHTVVEGILANDPARALRMVGEMADRGRDLEHVLADAVRFVRDLLVHKLCPEHPELLDITEGERTELDRLTAHTPAERLQRILDGFLDAQQPMSFAVNKRVYLEAVIIRITKAVHGVRIEDVLARLAGLRAAGALSNPPSASSAGPGAPGQDAPPPGLSDTSSPPARPKSASPAGPRPAAPVSPAPKPEEPSRASPASSSLPSPSTPGRNAGPESTAESAVAEAAPVYETPPARPEQSARETSVSAPEGAGIQTEERRPPQPPAPETSPRNDRLDPSPGMAPPARETAAPSQKAAPGAPAGEPSPPAASSRPTPSEPGSKTPARETPAELWHRLIGEVNRIPGKKPLAQAMRMLQPVSFIQGVLEIGIGEDVPQEMVEIVKDPGAEAVIQKCFSRISPVPGGNVLIRRYIRGLSDERRALRASPEVQEKLEHNPFVKMVSQIFGNAPIVEARG